MSRANMDYLVDCVMACVVNQAFQLFINWIVKVTRQAVQFEDQNGVCAKKVEGRNKRVKIKKYR